MSGAMVVHGWEFEPPEFEGAKISIEDWRLLLDIENMLRNLVYNKRYLATTYTSFGNINDPQNGVLTTPDVPMDIFSKWLSDPNIKLEKVMGFILRRLMVKKTYKEEVGDSTQNTTLLVFNTATSSDGKEERYTNPDVLAFIDNHAIYKEGLVEELVQMAVLKIRFWQDCQWQWL